MAETLSGESSSEPPSAASSYYLQLFGFAPADNGSYGCCITPVFDGFDLFDINVLPASAVPKSSEHPVVLPGYEDVLLLAFDCCAPPPLPPSEAAIDAIYLY